MQWLEAAAAEAAGPGVAAGEEAKCQSTSDDEEDPRAVEALARSSESEPEGAAPAGAAPAAAPRTAGAAGADAARDEPRQGPQTDDPDWDGRELDDREWQQWAQASNEPAAPDWEGRVLQLVREAKIGLGLSSLAWSWQERWPREKIEDWRPCKKAKDSVQKHVSDIVIVNDNIFECKPGACLDASEASQAQELAASIHATSREERNDIREAFQEEGRVTRWLCSYESIAQGESVLYRCVLQCFLPWEPAPGQRELAGPWAYLVEGERYQFSISERLVYSEADPSGGMITGTLSEGEGGWLEARTMHGDGRIGPIVRLRFLRGRARLEVQSRDLGIAMWSCSAVARRSLQCSFTGYGGGPGMSAVSAMERALQDPRMPPSRPRVAHPSSPSSKGRKAAAVAEAEDPASQRFEAATRRLTDLLDALTDLRRHIKEAGDPGVPGEWREDDQEERQEHLIKMGELLELLVEEVCEMLAGDDPVPLTDPRWQTSKLLALAWQHTLAVQDTLTLKRVGLAVHHARERLDAPAAAEGCVSKPVAGLAEPAAAAPLEPGAAPEVGTGMPFSLWEALLEWSARVAHMDPLDKPTGMAEAGLAELPSTLVPAELRYSAHFLHLLHYERAAELRQEYSKEMEAASRDDKPFLQFEGEWGSLKQHRPDVELRLIPESLIKRNGGPFIRKGDIALLLPEGASSWKQSLPVELRNEFDGSLKDPQVLEEKQRVIKLKHWSVTLPAGEMCELFRATTFNLVPLRSSCVTHDRQAEAVRNMAKRAGGCIHPAVRAMVLESWVAAHGPACPGPGAAEAHGAPAAAASEGPAACAAGPRQLAAERPEDLSLPPGGELADGLGPAVGCGIPLTEMQQISVKDASSRRCTLIRGPPGTGKTHTACAIIERWMALIDGCRILVVTQSNAAALNIQERLQKFGLPSVRVGMQIPPEELLSQPHFQELLDAKELKPLRDAAARQEEVHASVTIPLLQKAAKLSQVVVMTCISSGNMSLINSSFHRVLLDEAAQATEPTALVPLMTGAGAFACVGDDRQLPATILSHVARRQGLDESLFERFVRSEVVTQGDGFVQLDVQRRMHSSIARFPSDHFYGGGITNGCRDEERPPIPGLRWPGGGAQRVLFVDCAAHGGAEEPSGTSTRNPVEAELLASTLAHLLSARDSSRARLHPSEVACITGYSAQKEMLRHHLRRFCSSFVRVDTVDGFQGMERDLVLVSCTRANSTGDIGFLKDRRRANVLLTRARRGLIVFGDNHTLWRDPEIWGPWLQWTWDNHCWVTSKDLQAMLK